jgi:hypothetical protein
VGGGDARHNTYKQSVNCKGKDTIFLGTFSVCSHGNKTSRSRSVVKQKGMVFGFRKTATAVVGPEIEEEVFGFLAVRA